MNKLEKILRFELVEHMPFPITFVEMRDRMSAIIDSPESAKYTELLLEDDASGWGIYGYRWETDEEFAERAKAYQWWFDLTRETNERRNETL